jgi:hypothetical protein
LTQISKSKSLEEFKTYKLEFGHPVSIFSMGAEVMALPVMEFQDQGYKIRKVFA